MQYLIVGAGPTGLGACWALDRAGHDDWLLVESLAVAGGLAGSCIDAHGFTWDYGGHVQFSHYAYFDHLMDELLGARGWLHHEREAWVWMRERFIPYPLQHNLHRLPEPLATACMDELRRAARTRATGPDPEHFAAWLEQQFGTALMGAFMRPYNEKVWAWPLEDMSWRWVGERVATVDVQRAASNFQAHRDDRGWGPNNTFRFPARGGTGAIWQALAARLAHAHGARMRFATRIIDIDPGARTARLDDGSQVRYGAMLSSMPLDQLANLPGLAPKFATPARDLVSSTTHVIGVALHGQAPAHLARKCWLYFPEANAPFYRVTVFSNYAPANVPDPGRHWSLLCEVAGSAHRGVAPGSIAADVVSALLSTRLIADRREVHHVWQHRLARGYPVPTRRRDAALAHLIPALERHHIFSRGRFGAWKYEVSNQDHSFAQGVELVQRWLEGQPEATLRLA